MSADARPQESDLSNRNWVAFVGPPLGFADAVVCRVAEVDGRTRIVELRVSGDGGPVPAAALRQLPLSAMEKVAASIVRANEARSVPNRFEVVWALDRLTEFLKAAPPPKASDSQIPGPPLVALYGRADGEITYVVHHDPPVDWTKGQAITDAFLNSVGEAYDAAIQRGEAPAKSIAEATGASQKTVQSWVYQGRRKGVIAPAQGKGRIK